MTIICGVVALIMTAMNFFKYFGTFLIFLSNCVPAVVGVFMADFLYTYKNGYPDGESIKIKWDWRGLVAVAVGIVLAYIGLPGLTQVWCVGGAFVIRILLNNVGNDSPTKIYQH